MLIRPETPSDYKALYDFVKTAFETAAVKDGTEQDFVEKLRAGANYLPELALVLEDDGKIAGFIMFTRTFVVNDGEKFEGLLAAPLAIALEYRDRGLGTLLMRTGLEKAKELGYKAVFLAGDHNYYQRFGFVQAYQFGIYMDMEVPEELLANLPEDLLENIMALELEPEALADVSGRVALYLEPDEQA